MMYYGTYNGGCSFSRYDDLSDAPWNQPGSELAEFDVEAWETAVNTATGEELERDFTCRVKVAEDCDEEEIIGYIKDYVPLMSDGDGVELTDLGIDKVYRV